MARHWDADEDRLILNAIGSYGVGWICQRTKAPYDYPNAPAHRSKAALYARARRLFGAGGLGRGAYSLRRLCQQTGYGPTHLHRAAAALNQRWRRLGGPGGAYLITDDQVDELLVWLQHDYWSPRRRLYVCAWCGTTQRALKGQALCGRCYFVYRRYAAQLELPHKGEGLRQFVLDLRSRVNVTSHATFLEGALLWIRGKRAPSRDTLRSIAFIARSVGMIGS